MSAANASKPSADVCSQCPSNLVGGVVMGGEMVDGGGEVARRGENKRQSTQLRRGRGLVGDHRRPPPLPPEPGGDSIASPRFPTPSPALRVLTGPPAA